MEVPKSLVRKKKVKRTSANVLNSWQQYLSEPCGGKTICKKCAVFTGD